MQACFRVPAAELIEFPQQLFEFIPIKYGPFSGDNLPILPRQETLWVQSLALQGNDIASLGETVALPALVSFPGQDSPL